MKITKHPESSKARFKIAPNYSSISIATGLCCVDNEYNEDSVCDWPALHADKCGGILRQML